MITKYICSYCGEEFEDIEKCRVHEDECADRFKDGLRLFVKGVGSMNGRTFIEGGYNFDDILIIQNKNTTAFYLLGEIMEEGNYINPVEATNGVIKSGFYYWSGKEAFWKFSEKWDDTLVHIVNTGSDIEDE